MLHRAGGLAAPQGRVNHDHNRLLSCYMDYVYARPTRRGRGRLTHQCVLTLTMQHFTIHVIINYLNCAYVRKGLLSLLQQKWYFQALRDNSELNFVRSSVPSSNFYILLRDS